MAPALTTAEPLWDLVEESLEEAAFYWKRWEADLEGLTRNLDAVWSWSEERLQGALDGVRVAGEQLARIAEPALRGEELPLKTVAAHLLAARSERNGRQLLAEALRAVRGPALSALIRGIEVSELDGSFAPVTAALASGTPEHRAALCRLKSFRRSPLGREFGDAYESGEPELQALVLRALRPGADPALAKYVEAGLKSSAPRVRVAAIECGIRTRAPGAWDAAVAAARERRPDSAPVLGLLAALGSSDEQHIVIETLREPALRPAALFAIAWIGTPEVVEICLKAMADPKLARNAGEAYCAITGAELGRDNLTASEPAGAEDSVAFEADALDADLIPRGADLWPLPNGEAVQRHWGAIKSQYAAGIRHLHGRPVSLPLVMRAMECGPMVRRAGLALELAIRTSGRYDVETTAFAGVQRQMMAAGRGRLAAPASS